MQKDALTRLDPLTGRRVFRGGVAVPADIQAMLDKGAERPLSNGPLASSVGWRDVLTPRRVMQADGTQVSNTTTETRMCPDYTFAADALEPGDAFVYTLFGSMSTVITTPGTITFRLRWGAAVSGTSLAVSGAFAPDPTAGSTSLSYMVQWTTVVRSVGATGSMMTFGNIVWNDFDDASATTIVGNLNMNIAPVSANAAVTVDTTAATALTPCVTFSVATNPTNLTNQIAILESIN